MALDPIGLSSKIVTVYGGSGFIGRHVAQALARRGYRVRAAVRRPDLAGDLQPLGNVGQIMPVQANVRYPWSVDQAAEGATALVNLVGILAPRGRQTFDAVQAEGARAVAEAAARTGARLVHMSALGADPQGATAYQRSKAAGEAAALAARPDAVLFRPSTVFGPEDHFFNRFAQLLRILPVFPLFGEGMTRLQPVYVGDVAEAIARAVDGTVPGGRVYELGGPEVKTLRQIIDYILEVIGRRRILLPVPFAAARLQAGVLEVLDRLSLGLMPRDLVFTRDQVKMLERDNVVSAPASAEGRTLLGIGIAPTAIEAIVPAYLWRFRRYGQFQTSRTG